MNILKSFNKEMSSKENVNSFPTEVNETDVFEKKKLNILI